MAGRTRVWKDNATKQAAYRARKQMSYACEEQARLTAESEELNEALHVITTALRDALQCLDAKGNRYVHLRHPGQLSYPAMLDLLNTINRRNLVLPGELRRAENLEQLARATLQDLGL